MIAGEPITPAEVQLVRPGSRAAITEYGQPGIICALPLSRP
jgi:hypothetical protein